MRPPIKDVLVVNPVPDGRSKIGVNRAERYVRTGRAEWVSNSAIRFTEKDPRHQAAIQHARQTAAGYDQRGVLNRSEMRRIPVLFPEKLK